MWKTYLTKHLKRSPQEPFSQILHKKIKEQFERMTPMERWTAISLIENKKIVDIAAAAAEIEEDFEEDFEDTIYLCEKCGSKKIDTYQKQLRGAVSDSTVVYVFCFFSLCFASTGRTNDIVSHVHEVWGEVDGKLVCQTSDRCASHL